MAERTGIVYHQRFRRQNKPVGCAHSPNHQKDGDKRLGGKLKEVMKKTVQIFVRKIAEKAIALNVRLGLDSKDKQSPVILEPVEKESYQVCILCSI